MKPVVRILDAALLNGDSREVLSQLPENVFDSCVTDPPYELGFMGKSWDSTGVAYDVKLWEQVYRVLKPGGHLLAFGAPRNYHRLAVAIEDAGFEIRDSIHWIYGSGFPKSLDVSKAVDKYLGNEREVVGSRTLGGTDALSGIGAKGTMIGQSGAGLSVDVDITAPASDEAKQWSGWGTGLRPAHEPIVLARKPFKSTVAVNVLTYGTGAINIAASRVGTSGGCRQVSGDPSYRQVPGGQKSGSGFNGHGVPVPGLGRTPTNLVFSHLPECVETGTSEVERVERHRKGISDTSRSDGGWPDYFPGMETREKKLDTVPTFDCAPGCPVAELDTRSRYFPVFKYQGKAQAKEKPRDEDGKTHTTIKPLALMQWLVRLVTPPNGVILDPFNGSGTTGEAAILEGFKYIGIDCSPEFNVLTENRWKKHVDGQT